MKGKADKMEQIDKIKAAYALNLCTVSVSQIIDYDDLYVLEQEYDAILNNLNLEQMPKDEALLHILKQLLDTITFFRIEEGEKKIIEHTYEYKMKEAIWSAVPNLSVVVAGGGLKSMAVALASQIGIGYLNYRRNRSQYVLEHEQEQWRIQRTAIEQFNALRRELFDTAWRIAAVYEFPDEYRLTERQIEQYDNILMDPDDLRRFERLEFIQDKFLAYPPFWYYLGSAANRVSRGSSVPEFARGKFKIKAIECFKKFEESEKYDLLRDDQLACGCMLEHIELLSPDNDKAEIERLLRKVVSKSGNANDILQLCATGFLRIGVLDDAERLFRRLVNEQYNTVTNAQILSSIYVRKKLMNPENAERISADYSLLASRVDKKYLFPDTIYIEDSDRMFRRQLREILKKKIELVLNQFEESLAEKFNAILPKLSAHETSNNRQAFNIVAAEIRDMDYPVQVISFFNRMMQALDALNFVKDYPDKEYMVALIKDEFDINKNILISVQMSLNNGSFSEAEYEQLERLTFDRYTKDFFIFLIKEGKAHYDRIESLEEMAFEEENIRHFCEGQDIEDPEILFSERNDYAIDETELINYFDENIFGSYIKEAKKRKESSNAMLDIIRKRSQNLFVKGGKTKLLLKGEPEFTTYFYQNAMQRQKITGNDAFAILDDTGLADNDLLLTTEGIIRVERGTAKKVVPYSEIRYREQGREGLTIQGLYTNPVLNMSQLMSLIKELSVYQLPIRKAETNARRTEFFNKFGDRK